MLEDVTLYGVAPEVARVLVRAMAVGAEEAAVVKRGFDAEETLAAAAAQQRVLNILGWQQLVTAAHWADLHSDAECSGAATVAARAARAAVPVQALKGGELMAQRGGDGTPLVAEFAPAELAAALGISVTSAGSLIADALDLRHRLPRLWHRMQTGTVKTFVARRVASRTRRLSIVAAARVDAKVAPLVASVPVSRLEKILDAAIIAADPELAAEDAKVAAERRGVWRSREVAAGTATVFGCADAPDIAAFDTSLNQVATALALLGDDATLEVRRAKALGVLANPQAALQLVDTAEAARQARCTGGAATRQDRRRCTLGPATLYVHVAKEGLDAGAGVARVEDLGPALLEQVRGWLGDRTVRVQPVIDLHDMPAVDAYEIPHRIAEAARLRTPADCFPHGVNLGRGGDLDHNIPYTPVDDGGPPGQTRVGNLGRMTRPHHRIKTHGHWKVTQPRSGVWLWQSPHHYGYLVDHTGTTPLGKLG